ncbi:hypothetical protein B5K06_26200 [Rhizobium grahamii]|uniref:Uncharacterized protein n=1 Tax=Rhizobium grahamii TaxID=1120045 RepID=A0A370KHQ6_9HYPH|nr:hypothetical protein B5K06_26200 [Rhizobium grahamii]
MGEPGDQPPPIVRMCCFGAAGSMIEQGFSGDVFGGKAVEVNIAERCKLRGEIALIGIIGIGDRVDLRLLVALYGFICGLSAADHLDNITVRFVFLRRLYATRAATCDHKRQEKP